ncbi:DUF3375 domain-containing protein [Cellulomonas sp. URHE0023]|uniref:DUF3375 domain-containing protein n=1 Tax=Cellulomonas sp. URHE0023 TaxID=1380354 RepID=UPI000487C0FE|nr:DUF3375 domain-containing protein [Cellulomonas sp. URHE0023]
MITRAEGAYLGAVRAFQNPMLDLLHKRYAPLVVSLLSLLFTSDRRQIPVSDAHTEVGDALDQLRAAGYGDDLPVGSARDVCRGWADAGWLVRQVLDDDVEVYRLSAHAVGALEVAGRAGGARARVSQSRVRTLLDAVERLAQDADPDVMVRIARLDTEIARLRQELERVERTGQVDTVDDEQLVEEAENVVHLVRELPADFARVAESIRAMQRDVVHALRQDERPTGEVLREYLERGEHVMEATPEGRAFAGALRLIGDPQRLDQLAGQLDVVLRQPFTKRLPAQQLTELRELARRIEHGLDLVFAAQREASLVITAQVRNHDPLRDRQVDELLRDVMTGLQRWMPDARRGQAADPLRRLPVAEVEHLRQTPGELRPSERPAALETWDDDGSDVSHDEARAWGGPQYALLDARLAAAAGGPGVVDVADAFNAAPDALRRPVDLLGMLELAHARGMTETDELAFVDTLRPDGTRRRFALGGVTTTMKDTDD